MLPTREILLGAVTRFIPGAILTYLGLTLLFEGTRVFGRLAPLSLAFLGILCLGLGAGYSAALVAVRGHLRQDADFSGGQNMLIGSLAAGLTMVVAAIAPSLWLSSELHAALGWTLIPAVGFVSGVAATIAMYSPWLTRHRAAAAQGSINI